MVNSTAEAAELPTKVTSNNWQVLDTPKTAKAASTPLAVAAPLVPPQQAEARENAPQGMTPTSAGDKLEGYVPRFFLKEDGKDDNP